MNRYFSQRLTEIGEALRLFPPLNPAKYKRHNLRVILRDTKRERDRFAGLQTIDADAKKSIYPTVRRTINRLHTSQSPTLCETLLLVTPGLAFTIFVMFRGTGRIFDKFAHDRNLNGWFLVAGFAISYVLIFLVPKRKTGISRGWFWFNGLMLAVFLAAASPWSRFGTRDWWFSALYSFMVGAGVWSCFIAIVFIANTPLLLFIARRLRQHADARVLTQIIALMDETERNPMQWEDLPFRVGLARSLDKVAGLFENGLPGVYSSSDDSFQRWMRARSYRIAMHIRDLKKWLAIPRADTREYFLSALGRIVICVGRGDWDGIPAATSEAETRRAGRISTFLSALRTLVASILPATILLVLHLLHREPPSPIAGYLTFAAAAWLVVGFISLLDPLYSSRLEAFKAALSFLPGVKKGD